MEEYIKEEVNRCLNCVNAKCKQACPLQLDIPQITKLIKEDKLEEAFEIAFNTNPLGMICSLVCPHEKQCQGSCVRGINGEPIQIGKIEYNLWKWFLNNKEFIKNEIDCNVDAPKVAVVGGGPSGIACASKLLREGYDVTIFEKENYLGGILIYGIPDFRLRKDEVAKNIEVALSKNKIGKLNIIYNTILINEKEKQSYPLYNHITIKELKEKFDEVYIAVGAEKSKSINVATKETKNFIKGANSFLRENENLAGKTVAVIGGGNVAIDAARKATKENAKTTIIYRRLKENMPANASEIDEAEKDGVQFVFKTNVVSTRLNENGKLILSLDNQEEFKCDLLIEAIGSEVNKDYFEDNTKFTESNFIDVDFMEQQNIFVGGDTISSKSTVANAVYTGLNSANRIIAKHKKIT